MYQPNNFLRKAVEEGNVDKVRGALVGIIQSDPGFETDDLDEAIAYVKRNGINPFVAVDDPQFPMTNDFAESATYLRHNFTQKRLEHIRAVGRATHPVQKTAVGASYPSSSAKREMSQQHTGSARTTGMSDDKGEQPKKAWGRWILLGLLILAALLLILYLQN